MRCAKWKSNGGIYHPYLSQRLLHVLLESRDEGREALLHLGAGLRVGTVESKQEHQRDRRSTAYLRVEQPTMNIPQTREREKDGIPDSLFE
jgi:hypothetical protein